MRVGWITAGASVVHREKRSEGNSVAKDHPAKSEDSASQDAESPAGKGRPTPSRKEAQAAKAQPLVGGRDKAALKAQRQKQADARERARIGMAQGDERYLPARDKGVQRRFVRDYVDARFSVGEFLIPLMVVALILTFLPAEVQIISIAAVWVFLALAVIDAVILGWSLKRRLAQKFGADKVQPGFRWYAAMRAMQFRMLRMPKPQVKRLQFPE